MSTQNAHTIQTALWQAGLFLAVTMALVALQRLGWLGKEDGARNLQILMGLWLAGYGNMMPKQVSRLRSIAGSRRRQTALRVSGWAFTLAGLAQAGLWLLAPRAIAGPLSMGAVGLATAICLSYAVSCWARAGEAARRDD